MTKQQFKAKKTPDILLKTSKATEKDGKRYVEGYASTTHLDRVEDIVTVEALKMVATKIKRKGYNTVLYNHNRDMSIGKVVEATVNKKGLFVKVQISKAKSVEDIWIQIKEGILNSFSIGYSLGKYELDKDKDGRIRSCRILSMDLHEISIVTVPCNTRANITNITGKSLTKKQGDLKMAKKSKKASLKGVLKELLPSIVKDLMKEQGVSGESLTKEDVASAVKEAMASTVVKSVKLKTAKIKKQKKVKKSIKTRPLSKKDILSLVKQSMKADGAGDEVKITKENIGDFVKEAMTVLKGGVDSDGRKGSDADDDNDDDNTGDAVVKAFKGIDDDPSCEFAIHCVKNPQSDEAKALTPSEEKSVNHLFMAICRKGGFYGLK